MVAYAREIYKPKHFDESLRVKGTENRHYILAASGLSWAGDQMKLVGIQVESYPGAKADETPRSFNMNGQVFQIAEVLDRWHQVESLPEWPIADYFKVHGEDGRDYLLKHDLESDEWFVGKSW
jgi:hypothetical protein